ncbi:MAG TPA: methyltransferase domain-containing protein [Candidatus Avipropionibacterium avicola]|uniref:Methyltransferase domain-containing protein n=1 Tax=Candidatus Avipropionibacterium avicola TaxID=2840701 RepID=A0A9D1GZK4_9ACTN|nr:methyltransferase domain-containing protein [Candidatus Avipropionibacterium avicola]
MITDVIDLLRCPHCGTALELDGRVVACHGRHRFDLARQGHLNLLSTPAPANADSAAMVAARLAYLERGLHQPVRDLLSASSGPVVLDAGCGPGWYLAGLPAEHRVLGMDLSAAAARRAARAHPRAGVVVSDLRQDWPVADAVVDTVWSVFAPRHLDEVVRVLRPGGEFLVVLPGEDHLVELVRSGAVIGQQRDKEASLLAQLSSRLEPTRRDTVRTTVTISDDTLVHELVAMGPSAHHRTEPPGSDRHPRGGTTSQPEQVTVSLIVRAFRLDPGGS